MAQSTDSTNWISQLHLAIIAKYNLDKDNLKDSLELEKNLRGETKFPRDEEKRSRQESKIHPLLGLKSRGEKSVLSKTPKSEEFNNFLQKNFRPSGRSVCQTSEHYV